MEKKMMPGKGAIIYFLFTRYRELLWFAFPSSLHASLFV